MDLVCISSFTDLWCGMEDVGAASFFHVRLE
jgi:hypothetical protein